MGHEHVSRHVVMVVVAALVIVSLAPTWAAEPPLQIVMDANSLSVRAGSAALLQYRYGDVAFKPYVRELFTPGGLNVLLDSPPDHVHHHALMFACAVNNVDFWGEAVGPVDGHFERLPGRQRPLRDHGVVVDPLGAQFARLAEGIVWVPEPEVSPLLLELRTITSERIDPSVVTFLTWESKLTVPEGKESATLTGSHYHGLGMRFVRSMDTNGQFRNPDNDPGVIFRGEERLARSRWCAYTAQVDGKTVTAAMFDHPDNPRHPATWFMMAQPFAYLSATMRLHEEPLKVLAGKPLTLRYGVALWDGRPEVAQIDKLYRQWTAMTPTSTGEVRL